MHTSLVIRGHFFSALISHEIMCFNNNQNVGILLLFVKSQVVVKRAESFAANTESRFRFPKTGEEESKLLQGSIPKAPFIWKKVVPGRRVTRLPELPWASQLFLHFLTKLGEPFT